MHNRKVISSLVLVLLIILVATPVVAAQEPTATPPTWIPPAINVTGVCSCDCVGIQGSCVTYTIVVQNNATVSWYNARVTDPVDSRLTIVSATSTLGTASISGNTVTVDGINVLAPQQAFTIVITARLTQSPMNYVNIQNTARIDYDAPPPPDGDSSPQEPIFSETDTTRIPCCPEDVQPPDRQPPVVPEASTLVLLGSAASGLAGYVSLQIRARRRKRD